MKFTRTNNLPAAALVGALALGMVCVPKTFAQSEESELPPARGEFEAAPLPPAGTVDQSSVAAVTERGATREIKEWQAIMDHLRSLPIKSNGELPDIPIDERANEVRAIKAA